MDAAQTPTVRIVAESLGHKPVSVREVVEALLERHQSDYPSGFAIDWPEAPRLATVDRWLTEARELLNAVAHDQLHGRAVILALALADPPSGRALLRSGFFSELSRQLQGRFVDGLTPAGLERLDEIPLIGAIEGVAMGAVTLAGSVNDIAVSPNDQLLAVGHSRGWAVLTRSRRREVQSVDDESVTHIGFSRDGRVLITGSEDAIRYGPVRGGGTSVEMSSLPVAIGQGIVVASERVEVDGIPVEPLRDVVRAAIAGRVVAAATAAGVVTVWNADTQTELGRIDCGEDLSALAVSPDGATLITCAPFVARWDVASGRQEWLSDFGFPGPVALSPDGSRVAGVSLLDGATGAEIVTLGNVTVVAFSPDGTRLATGDEVGIVQIRNPVTGALIGVLAHTEALTALTWAPGDQLVTGTAAGTLAAWACGFEPVPRRKLAVYTADDTRAADNLGERLAIDADVDAIAALLAARTVEPPLSIGLFGAWGSGKSFFMRRLHARIAELSAEARDSGELQRDVAWHKQIVQIHFNAWHYAEANLWASLVENILINLKLVGEDPDDVEERRSEVLSRLVDQQAITSEAHEQAERALADLISKRAALVQMQADDPLRTASSEAVRETVKAATDAVLAAHPRVVGETYAELGAVLRETQSALTRGAEVLVPLVRAPDRRRRLLWLFAVLALGPGAAWAVSKLAPDVEETLTGIVALLGGAAAWLQRQAAWTRDRLDQVQRAEDELDAPVRELREQHEREVALLQAGYDVAVRKVADEQARIEALEAELAQATPERLLAERVGDYRRQLGVLAGARRDFDVIARYLMGDPIEIEAYESLEQEESETPMRIGRIVLYIDDLDRCEPDQVVAVLQAVHLLLASPLFTVVVGVDVRWVERALRLHHPQLLDPDEDGAEPRDYLEKIFQIPFWLEPLDVDASRAMLRGLVGAPAPSPGRAAPAPPPQDGAAQPGESPSERAVPEAVAPAAPPPALAPPRDPRPESLEVGEVELAAMDALAPLLGRSPRALKRFVNTYRLIKVRAPDPIAHLRDDPPIAPYRAHLFLLALVTGLPHTAAAFLDAILADTPGTVEEHLPSLPWLATEAAAGWRAVPLEALRPHAEEVVRFTFHPHQSMYS